MNIGNSMWGPSLSKSSGMIGSLSIFLVHDHWFNSMQQNLVDAVDNFDRWCLHQCTPQGFFVFFFLCSRSSWTSVKPSRA